MRLDDIEPRPQSRARLYLLAVAATMITACVLVVGVYVVLNQMRAADKNNVRIDNAQSWAQHLARHTPQIADLFAGGDADGAQMVGVNMVLSAEHLLGFALIDPAGDIRFVTDHFHWDMAPAEREIARNVIADGTGHVINDIPADVMSDAHTTAGHEHDHGEQFVGIIVPIKNADGKTLGAAAFVKAFEDGIGPLDSASDRINYALPLVAAILFLLPMLLMIHFLDKARRKDHALLHMSRFDPLTGVLNRGGFAQRMAGLFDAQRRADQQIGLVYLDVDSFRSINDTFGQGAGDAYLRQLAKRLGALIPDRGIVGRFGGDEFVLALPDMTPDAVMALAAEASVAGRTPLELGDVIVASSVCVGTYLASADDDAETALGRVDLAITRAKAQGRNQIVNYDTSMDAEIERQRQIESCLRVAISDDLLRVHYQPIFDGAGARVLGFEALLRLHDHDGTMIPPDQFIPLAERMGIINAIGLWVLETAIADVARWPDDLFVAVNLSAVQFHSTSLPQKIIERVHRAGLPAARLELELTESVLLSDDMDVTAQIAELQAAGIRIAMDDFGTGYSNLGYLWKYHLDKLKIDKSFLQGHERHPERYRDIIATIVLLGHKMGMKVTIEGVEKEEQSALANALHADQIQGFYFARPMPVDAVSDFLESCAIDMRDTARQAG